MLPQIKLMQAVGRVFPGQSGQYKHGSSTKKKEKGGGGGSEQSSGPEALELEGAEPGSVCVRTAFPPFQARGAPLFAALDPSLPGGLE